MSKRRNRVCGADVHRDLIVATIIDDDNVPLQEQFGTTFSELRRFKDWLKANNCNQVAFEATGVYWLPIYDCLSQSIDTIVANPWMIKNYPKEKTDSNDSIWISSLCLNGQIKRSRVLSKEDRNLRTLTRARSGYIKTRTQCKNRIHKYLASNGIKLSSVISNIFGKSGRYILDNLAKGTGIDVILDGIPSGKIRKKRDLIKGALATGLDDTNRMLISDALDIIDHLEAKVDSTSLEIFNQVQKKKKDLAIVMSIPGIGFVAASTILAEIGDYHDFQKPEQLAKWCGLTPGQNESAGKKRSCGITKQGSKYLRTILVEVAHVVARMNNTYLSKFFLRMRQTKNYNVAVTALARKLICLIHHLLMNQELYQEISVSRRKPKPDNSDSVSASISEDLLTDKVSAIIDAYYHLTSDGGAKDTPKKMNLEGGG